MAGASLPPSRTPRPHAPRVALRVPARGTTARSGPAARWPAPGSAAPARGRRAGSGAVASFVTRCRTCRTPDAVSSRSTSTRRPACWSAAVTPGGPLAVDLDRGDLQPRRPVGAVRPGPRRARAAPASPSAGQRQQPPARRAGPARRAAPAAPPRRPPRPRRSPGRAVAPSAGPPGRPPCGSRASSSDTVSVCRWTCDMPPGRGVARGPVAEVRCHPLTAPDVMPRMK